MAPLVFRPFQYFQYFAHFEPQAMRNWKRPPKELEWSMKRKQSQTEDVMEKIQMKAMFQDLQKKSAQIDRGAKDETREWEGEGTGSDRGAAK
jgi:hypothetical protein